MIRIRFRGTASVGQFYHCWKVPDLSQTCKDETFTGATLARSIHHNIHHLGLSSIHKSWKCWIDYPLLGIGKSCDAATKIVRIRTHTLSPTAQGCAWQEGCKCYFYTHSQKMCALKSQPPLVCLRGTGQSRGESKFLPLYSSVSGHINGTRWPAAVLPQTLPLLLPIIDR